MASAARILLFVSLVFGGLSGSAAAGIQLDPADTLNSTVSTATTQTGDITDAIGSVDDATDGDDRRPVFFLARGVPARP